MSGGVISYWTLDLACDVLILLLFACWEVMITKVAVTIAAAAARKKSRCDFGASAICLYIFVPDFAIGMQESI